MQPFDAREYIDDEDFFEDHKFLGKSYDKKSQNPTGGTSKMKDVLEQNNYYSRQSDEYIKGKIKINDRTKY